MSNNKETNNPFDIFIRGARKGFTLATQNLLPNVLMAYTLAELLRILGIMAFLGNLFAPAMALFGLPGESVTILLTAWLSYSAGVVEVPKKYWPMLMTISIVNALISMLIMKIFV